MHYISAYVMLISALAAFETDQAGTFHCSQGCAVDRLGLGLPVIPPPVRRATRRASVIKAKRTQKLMLPSARTRLALGSGDRFPTSHDRRPLGAVRWVTGGL